jgi:hypothetical protein
MSFNFSATVRGHPWDLWGLAQLFDGNNPDKIKLVAEKPDGAPQVDFTNEAARTRFQRLGHNLFSQVMATISSWGDSHGDGPQEVLLHPQT